MISSEVRGVFFCKMYRWGRVMTAALPMDGGGSMAWKTAEYVILSVHGLGIMTPFKTRSDPDSIDDAKCSSPATIYIYICPS